MSTWAFLFGAAAVLLAATGWWRYGLLPFTIRAGQMTVARLGLRVAHSSDVQRVEGILASFAGGFNAMLTGPSWRAWQRYCSSLPATTRPFAEEGAAMGWTARRLFRYDAAAFEREIVKPRPEFRYLYYVGLGFWSGMRGHSPQRLLKIAEGLDPLHRNLCFDGYGFKHAFFDYPKDPSILRKLDALPDYARNAAYQGVGRAFFFLFMDEPSLFVERAAALGDVAADVAAGAGLAAVFVNPDRLEVAMKWAAAMPDDWRAHFHLGMCFALKARSINDLDEFERCVSRLDREIQDAVWASVRECDRVELLVRAEKRPDGYRQWRSSVTQWMTENIEYPLAGVHPRGDQARPQRVGASEGVMARRLGS